MDSSPVAITLRYFIMKNLNLLNLKNFMAPFYGWGSTDSKLEPLRGGSLIFTPKFPEIPATHFIYRPRKDERLRMKG